MQQPVINVQEKHRRGNFSPSSFGRSETSLDVAHSKVNDQLNSLFDPQLRNLKKSILLAIPDEVRDHVKLLLNTEPTVRPDADQLSKVYVQKQLTFFDKIKPHFGIFIDNSFGKVINHTFLCEIFVYFSKIPFFEDVGAMTLQYLDSLMQRDNLQKSQFFKGLPQVIAKMPKVSTLK